MLHPRVTIHLGQPKTGTSAIQAICAANRILLVERAKLLYPSLPEHFLYPYPQHQEFVFQRSGGGWRSPQEVGEFFAKAFEACDAHGIRHIVLSWEAFFEVEWMDLVAESFGRLGVRPDFIVYLRRQDAWLESAWKQWHNKMPGDPSVSEYARTGDFDWYYLLSLWSERFPKESIRVRPYEKQQLPDGLIADFFVALGYTRSLASVLVPASEDNMSRNSGFSPDVISMLTALRGLNRDRHDARLFDFFGDLLGDEFKKREFESYRLLSPTDRIELLQKFEPSNQRIAREYLGREDGRLFLDPWPDPSESWNPPDGLTLERSLPILVSMQMTLRERFLAQESAMKAFGENAVAQQNVIAELQERLAAQAAALQKLQERSEA